VRETFKGHEKCARVSLCKIDGERIEARTDQTVLVSPLFIPLLSFFPSSPHTHILSNDDYSVQLQKMMGRGARKTSRRQPTTLGLSLLPPAPPTTPPPQQTAHDQGAEKRIPAGRHPRRSAPLLREQRPAD
jgi:hypothetical protein